MTQQNFESNVKKCWQNQFKKENHRINKSSSISEIKNAGFDIVTTLFDKELRFADQYLDINSSNGCFCFFSDGEHPYIGWRYDWKEIYNGKEWITD